MIICADCLLLVFFVFVVDEEVVVGVVVLGDFEVGVGFLNLCDDYLLVFF